MSDIVTGMPAAIGYTNGYGNGWSESYHHAGELRTRDILESIRDNAVAVEKIGAANSLATEKTAAATSLAVEKIGAANIAAIDKIGASAVLETHDQAHLLALQLCDMKATMLAEMQKCCCDLKESVGEVKATVLAVDANRIRDDLHQARTELMMLRSASHGNGNGNGR